MELNCMREWEWEWELRAFSLMVLTPSRPTVEGTAEKPSHQTCLNGEKFQGTNGECQRNKA